jgi:glycosyltransferase involved in cell wall biosynthesis
LGERPGKGLCCAVIPTFNNAGTLEKVLTDAAQHIPYIIAVNDGSTDNTQSLLGELQESHPVFGKQATDSPGEPVGKVTLDVIHQPANRGKGKALQKGFERAVAAGFRYAVTIDADGQHFADDIPLFIRMIGKYPGSLIVGARNMQQDGVPGKSSFGNRFSNFWYRVETGIKLPDTQSGFRLYPVERLRGIHFFTRKYEFEIELLVRAAWMGCRIRWVPVRVFYAPEESRVSHFRPFRDFTRISLLNTVLVLIAFLWIKPRDMARSLNWRKTRRFFRRQFVNRERSAAHIAASAGFGVFMGIVPIWGYQLIAGIALAHFMKLNKAIVFITANISIPPMIPVILYLSFLTGGWIVDNPATSVSLHAISMDFVKHNLYQYLVGSVFFAVAAGIAVTLLVWLAVFIMRKNNRKPKATVS